MIRNRFIPNELSFKQLKAYQYLLFNQIDNWKELEQKMATISLASSWPFPTKSLNDPKGLLNFELKALLKINMNK
jgi:hypothetical protein